MKDEYGDVEKAERLRVLFKTEERVDDSDIVIDPEVRGMLWRNVIDLHERRNLLKQSTGFKSSSGPKEFRAKYLTGFREPSSPWRSST